MMREQRKGKTIATRGQDNGRAESWARKTAGAEIKSARPSWQRRLE
jgi:hypothetical protein